ncbi:hypothetical protein [Bacillus sp. NEB1478]|uniref:hypothetical protein n=1 Tax=Bacillus sp. NEB1478 TaxID=3073816 RepID=UPI00287313DF|nr:hypothetical protein [Bacillus sp. NEB1478]WNB91799.1 hypothetical protein RGB74_18275 [Bacillus sp. NEB1478]
MTILILLGMILTVVLLSAKKVWVPAGFVTSIRFKLKDSKLSTNHWIAGAAMFLTNALLFALAIILFFYVPFGMPICLIICIPLSMFIWYLFSETWQGSYTDKIKFACIGSSFFLVFIGWVVWKYSTLEPAFPGDDLFMAWIGTLLAIIVSSGAFVVSLFVILKKKRNNT